MKLLASCIVRLSEKGDAHGYLYLVDLKSKNGKKVFTWDDENIDWEGRGGSRGLRGIAFYKEFIIVSTSNRLLFLNKDFDFVSAFNSHLFMDIHEMSLYGDELYITSTQYDLVLVFNLNQMKITKGYFIKPLVKNAKKQEIFHKKFVSFKKKILYRFDFSNSFDNKFEFVEIDVNNYIPQKTEITRSVHINTVFSMNGYLCFTGTQYNYVFGIKDGKLSKVGTIPFGTHNVHPFNDGYIMNYTSDSSLVITNNKGKIIKKYPVKFDESNVKGSYEVSNAKAGWNRGLVIHQNMAYVGCSPATVNCIDLKTGDTSFITLDNDVRNSIHGLDILPERFY